MRRNLLAPLALAALAAAATPAAALDLPPLCQALHGLGEAARAGAPPLRVAVGPSGCAGETAAAKAFCAAAGGEPDTLAWDLLRTCLNSLAAEPQVTTSADAVTAGGRERKRITHMAAKLGHSVRLDLAYNAGRYDLVVWRPN